MFRELQTDNAGAGQLNQNIRPQPTSTNAWEVIVNLCLESVCFSAMEKGSGCRVTDCSRRSIKGAKDRFYLILALRFDGDTSHHETI